MTVSPDGHWLVTGDNAGTAWIWDLTTRKAPRTGTSSVALKGHPGRITAMAISPDNHWLIIAGDDNVIQTWTLRVDELIDLALQQVGRRHNLQVLAADDPITQMPPPVETGRAAATSFAPEPQPIPRISATLGPIPNR